MDGTFSQELLHIFQFDDINQKFTAILILWKVYRGIEFFIMKYKIIFLIK